METGVYTKNILRYITVNQIYRKIGAKLCEVLPHTTHFLAATRQHRVTVKARFARSKFSKRVGWLKTHLESLNSDETITQDIISTLEEFVCKLYGKTKPKKSVDETRFEMFLEKYKPKRYDQKITCVKKLNGSSSPPCSRVLLEKINRTKHIAAMTRSSSLPYPHNQYPEHMG